jgi:hypothetical protein
MLPSASAPHPLRRWIASDMRSIIENGFPRCPTIEGDVTANTIHL